MTSRYARRSRREGCSQTDGLALVGGGDYWATRGCLQDAAYPDCQDVESPLPLSDAAIQARMGVRAAQCKSPGVFRSLLQLLQPRSVSELYETTRTERRVDNLLSLNADGETSAGGILPV
ncbi:MAG TPA: hypothetical protein DEW46_05145 [Verrucomicrobia bacterium]|nr:hypothetical protein [Verrucomicrobiota bacterium]